MTQPKSIEDYQTNPIRLTARRDLPNALSISRGSIIYCGLASAIGAISFIAYFGSITRDYVTMSLLSKYGIETGARVIDFDKRPYRTGKTNNGSWNYEVKMAYSFFSPNGERFERRFTHHFIIPPPVISRGDIIEIVHDRNVVDRNAWRFEVDDVLYRNYWLAALFMGAYGLYLALFSVRCVWWLAKKRPQ